MARSPFSTSRSRCNSCALPSAAGKAANSFWAASYSPRASVKRAELLRAASSKALVCAAVSAMRRSWACKACRATSNAEVEVRHASRFSRSPRTPFSTATFAESYSSLVASAASTAAFISSSMDERRLRSAKRFAAGLGASAAAVNPSQRHTSPWVETRRWPGFNCDCSAAPTAFETTPTCERIRANDCGPCTNCERAAASPGSAAIASSGGSPRQNTGAPSSAEASISSPKAAAKAPS